MKRKIIRQNRQNLASGKRAKTEADQRLITDFFAWTGGRISRGVIYCRVCKRKFQHKLALRGHIHYETCTVDRRQRDPWTSLIHLPDLVLLAILKKLEFVDFFNALLSDERFLQVRGLVRLWSRHMAVSRPSCIFISENVKTLREVDLFLKFRHQGKYSDSKGRRDRRRYLENMHAYLRQRVLGLIIYRPGNNRQRCYCIH